MATANKTSKRRIVIAVLLTVAYSSAFAAAYILQGYKPEYAIALIAGIMMVNVVYSALYFVNEFRYDRVLGGRASLSEANKIQYRRHFFAWYWVVFVNVTQLFVFSFLFQYLYQWKGEAFFAHEFNNLNYFDWLLYTMDCVFKSVLDIPEIFGWHLRNIRAIHWQSQIVIAVVRLLIYTLLVAALLRQWKRWLMMKETIAAMSTAPQMAGRRLVRIGEDALSFVDHAMLKPEIFNPEPSEIDRLQRDEHSEPLLQMLLRNLTVGNPNERENAAILIGLLALEDRSSHPYFWELIGAAKSEESASVRREMVRTLGKLKDERAFFSIRQFLRDNEPEVRLQAARAIGKMGDVRGVSALSESLTDPAKEVRVASARALGRIGQKSACPALQEALKDPEAAVRVEATFSLAHLFEPSIGEQLLSLLDNDDPKIRRKAIECIKKVHPEGVENTLSALLQDEEAFVRLAATEVLGQLKPDLACHTILATNEQDPVVLRAQVAILRENNEERFQPFFVRASRHSDAFVRERALTALGEFNDDETVRELLKVMKNSDIDDAMHAIRSLGNTRNGNAYNPLYEVALNDKAPEHLRRQACRSLAWIDPERAKKDLSGVKVTNH